MGNSAKSTGFDVSYYNLNVDDEQVHDVLNITDFAILRGGYWGYKSDQGWVDDMFEEYYEKIMLPNPEIIRGIYWYTLSQANAQEQADFFIENCLKDKDFDFIAVDFEETNNIMSDAFAETHCQMLDILQAEYPNKRIYTYSRYEHYANWLSGTRADNYPYWHAQYPWKVWQPNDIDFIDWWRQVWDAPQTYFPKTPSSRPNPDNGLVWQCGGDQTWVGNEFGFENPNIDVNTTLMNKVDWINFIGIPERLKEDDPVIIEPPVVEPPVTEPPVVEPPVIEPECTCCKVHKGGNLKRWISKVRPM